MNTKLNQQYRTSDGKLRDALFACLERGELPTVEGLCRDAGVNRSTFYRHYLDLYDLMDKTEQTIQQGLMDKLNALKEESADPHALRAALGAMAAYMEQYAAFYRNYLPSHLDVSMDESFRSFWNAVIKPVFLQNNVLNEDRMLYYFRFFKTGIMSVLNAWLTGGCRETADEIGDLLYNILFAR